ncbi:hypothetical protein IAR50_006549 [Cryptococcus sp. DSM 104548]
MADEEFRILQVARTRPETHANPSQRFKDKEAASIKSTKFPKHFNEKVDLRKVNIAVLRPWIAEKVTELIKIEDDIVVEYAFGMLEDRDNPTPDPKKMQVSLIGFMDKFGAAAFMDQLWKLLLSAQKTVGGVPAEFIEAKKAELQKRQQEDTSRGPHARPQASDYLEGPPGDRGDRDRRHPDRRDVPPPRYRDEYLPRDGRDAGRDGMRGEGGWGGGRGGGGGGRGGYRGRDDGFGRRPGGGREFENRPRDNGYASRRAPAPRDRSRSPPPRNAGYDRPPPRDFDRRPPPSHRGRSPSPQHRRRPTPPIRPSSPRRGRDSATPPLRGGERGRSRSITPLSRRKDRSPSPVRRRPPPSVSRSPSRSRSPPRRRRPSYTPSPSRSRSPPRRRPPPKRRSPSMSRSRSRTRSLSPPPKRRRDYTPTPSRSPSPRVRRRSPSPRRRSPSPRRRRDRSPSDSGSRSRSRSRSGSPVRRGSKTGISIKGKGRKE